MYVLPEERVEYEFEAYPGLEVSLRVSPIPLGDWLAWTAMGTEEGEAEERLRARYGRFVELAQPRWNLPEEPDVDGLMHQPFQMVAGLMTAWSNSIAEVPVPLARRSNGIATSAATSRRSSKRPS